jgi:hypothetical protein
VIEMPPASMMMIAMTHAKIGRSMKNRAIAAATALRRPVVPAAPPPAGSATAYARQLPLP